MKLTEASREVLNEDERTRENGYLLWLYLVRTLNKMGFKGWIELNPKMPSPDAMLTERRRILNKQNMFPEDFIEEEGTTYEKPNHLNEIGVEN